MRFHCSIAVHSHECPQFCAMWYRTTHNNCTITHMHALALCIPGVVLHFLWHCIQWRVQTANVVVLPAPIALYQQMLSCGQVAHTTSAGNKRRAVLSPGCFETHRTLLTPLESKPGTVTYLKRPTLVMCTGNIRNQRSTYV